MKLFKLIRIIIFSMAMVIIANAQTHEIVTNSQSSNDGVEFHNAKNGLILSASLPKMAKSIDDIKLTLKLTNNTRSTFSFQEMVGILEGMRFKLVDYSGNVLPMTRDGKGEMGHFATEHHHEYLKADQTMIITVPIKDYIEIKKTGKYTLKVTWGEDMSLDDPFDAPRPPRLQLTGSFLLQNSVDGISISSAK